MLCKQLPCMANSIFAFWNFLEFFSNIFNLQWVESVHAEPTDTEGQLYQKLNYDYSNSLDTDKISDALSQARCYWYIPFLINCVSFSTMVAHVNKLYLPDTNYTWERYKVHQDLPQVKNVRQPHWRVTSEFCQDISTKGEDLRISQPSSFSDNPTFPNA